ncbi:hypothetical protein ACFQ0K_05070 [Nocardioides caeni]|uniref:Uncharacterized protein n=1 Tax=Nocardioides caeni TaxID=574700 RepID=A0A4S8N7T1_9ACTN|nr:hypothetical protein [Nocardioides caeni]THV12075.1 hypothetical protein E9934_11990 [Nocardioides caeni]
MRAAASRVLADELPEEFSGPVAYSDRWLWIVLGLLVLVLVYYVAAWWFTRAPKPATIARPRVDVPTVRERHLQRIDEVVAQVRAGDLEPRAGHQQLSDVVRSFVAEVTTLPARTMALADFRHRAPEALVAAIELMYPPEFAPDDTIARDRFEDAAGQARQLVGTWQGGDV